MFNFQEGVEKVINFPENGNMHHAYLQFGRYEESVTLPRYEAIDLLIELVLLADQYFTPDLFENVIEKLRIS